MKFILFDTFNDRVISRHRTLINACKAQRRHAVAVRRANGRDSYIPTEIRNADGTQVSVDDLLAAEFELTQ